MWWKLVRSEWLKLRKTNIWLLIFVSPALASFIGFLSESELGWLGTLGMMIPAHGLLFLPLLSGVFSAFVCRYEHQGNSWKQLLALPVSRRQVFLAKGFIVIVFLAFTQLLLLFGWVCVGTLKGFSGPFPWELMTKSIFGGLIASLPLAALQLWVSSAWASFAAPLALNVIMTIPNLLVVNSAKYGPWYPWSQPFLMMMPKTGDTFGVFYMPIETLVYVVLGSFVLFLSGGLLYFHKKAV